MNTAAIRREGLTPPTGPAAQKTKPTDKRCVKHGSTSLSPVKRKLPIPPLSSTSNASKSIPISRREQKPNALLLAYCPTTAKPIDTGIESSARGLAKFWDKVLH